MNSNEVNWEIFLNVAALVVINTIVILMMLIFYFTVYRSSKRNKEIADRQPTVFTNQFFREFWFWFTNPVFQFFLKAKIHPNSITRLSTFFALVSGILFGFGKISTGGWVLAISGTFDMLDGRIARARNQASNAGAFFDSVMDRYADFFVFAGIITFFALVSEEFSRQPQSYYITGLVLLSMLGAQLISYAKERGHNLGAEHSTGLMQRADRVAVLGLSAVFDPLIDRFTAIIWPEYINMEYHFALAFGLFLIAFFGNRTAIIRIRSIHSQLQQSRG